MMDIEYVTYIPKDSQDSVDTKEKNTDQHDGTYKKYYSTSSKISTEKEAVELVRSFKEPAEANVVLCLYQNPDLFLDCKLTEEDFTYNSWRVFFIIARDLNNEQKSLTEDNINFYLEQHAQLADKYKKYGGYNTLIRSFKAVRVSDFESYVSDIGKWNALLKISQHGFPIKEKLSDYADMSAEDIYDELTLQLNDAFIAVDEKVKSYNAFENLHQLNAELNEGREKGLDFGAYTHSCNILNPTVNGFNINGNIYGLGACTGVGKSWLTIQYLLPLVWHYKQKIVFIINEEDHTKLQREIETWYINNILLADLKSNKQADPQAKRFNKKRFFEGNFNTYEKTLLDQAATDLEAMAQEHLITIIPLERYSVNIAIKIIKKYNKLGVRMFCLDTFKESFDTHNVDTWKAMERDLLELYNVVKPTALNVGLFLTYQLGKQAVKLRYLTNTEVGQAKNIMDVITVNLMARKPYSDEYAGGKRQIEYTKRLTDSGTNIAGQHLDINKQYLLTFITKNRQGASDPYQIVSEVDQGYNLLQEIGIAHVPQDF